MDLSKLKIYGGLAFLAAALIWMTLGFLAMIGLIIAFAVGYLLTGVYSENGDAIRKLFSSPKKER